LTYASLMRSASAVLQTLFPAWLMRKSRSYVGDAGQAPSDAVWQIETPRRHRGRIREALVRSIMHGASADHLGEANTRYLSTLRRAAIEWRVPRSLCSFARPHELAFESEHQQTRYRHIYGHRQPAGWRNRMHGQRPVASRPLGSRGCDPASTRVPEECPPNGDIPSVASELSSTDRPPPSRVPRSVACADRTIRFAKEYARVLTRCRAWRRKPATSTRRCSPFTLAGYVFDHPPLISLARRPFAQLNRLSPRSK